MNKILRNWAPVLVYVGLVFLGSSIPTQVKPGVDKALHVLEYTVLGFFVNLKVKYLLKIYIVGDQNTD